MVPKLQANLSNKLRAQSPSNQLQNLQWKLIVSALSMGRSAAHLKFEFIQSSHVIAGTWRGNRACKVQALCTGYSL